jgi:serine/threonine protein kinase
MIHGNYWTLFNTYGNYQQPLDQHSESRARISQLELELKQKQQSLNQLEALFRNPPLDDVVKLVNWHLRNLISLRNEVVKKKEVFDREYHQYSENNRIMRMYIMNILDAIERKESVGKMYDMLQKMVDNQVNLRVKLIEAASKINRECDLLKNNSNSLSKLDNACVLPTKEYALKITLPKEFHSSIQSIVNMLKNVTQSRDKFYERNKQYDNTLREIRNKKAEVRIMEAQLQNMREQSEKYSVGECGRFEIQVARKQDELINLTRKNENEKQSILKECTGICDEMKVVFLRKHQVIENQMDYILKQFDLYVERNLKIDYQVFKTTQGGEAHTIISFAKLRGTDEEVVLKGTVWSNQSLKRIKNEIKIMHNVDHPSIVRLRSVFLQDNIVYMELPYFDNGDLLHWLKRKNIVAGSTTVSELMRLPTQRDPEEIKVVLRQTIVGLSYLHSVSIVHRDIKPSNILISKHGEAKIADFGISKTETESEWATSLATQSKFGMQGTQRYMAPELLSSKKPTCSTACDMYAMGVVIFDAFTPYSEQATINMQTFKKYNNDPLLIDLVSRLIDADPDNRLSANECLLHAYFNKVQDKESDSSKRLIQTRIFLKNARKNCTRSIPILGSITATRGKPVVRILTDVIKSYSVPYQLFQKWFVHFEGESGIDSGGLTKDLISMYFEELFDEKSKFFERSGSEVYLPVSCLPSTMTEQQLLLTYEVFGRFLLKCLVEGTAIHLKLASFCYRFLIDCLPKNALEWIYEAEQFDPQFGSSMRYLTSCPNVTEIMPDESFADEDGTSKKLTNSNATDYIISKCKEKLYGTGDSRRKYMMAIKRGFRFCENDMLSYISGLTHLELQLLLCGESYIDGDIVLQQIIFATSRRTTEIITKALKRLTQEELRLFLKWTTGLPSIPYGGLQNKIRIQPSDSFYAHTCDNMLEIDERITDEQTFYLKLQECIRNGAYGSMDENFSYFNFFR